MSKKKPINRAMTREQVEHSLQLKEAHLPRLQASTIPQEQQARFLAAIERDRQRIEAWRVS